MKKFIIRAASGIVLDVLLDYALQQRDRDGLSAIHYDRWNTIALFLAEMRTKGIPL